MLLVTISHFSPSYIQFWTLLFFMLYYALRTFPGLKCQVDNVLWLRENSPYDVFSHRLQFSSLLFHSFLCTSCDEAFPCTLILIPVSDDLLGQTPRGRCAGSWAMGKDFWG